METNKTAKKATKANVSLAYEIVETSKDLNNVLESVDVKNAFRTHYVDTDNQVHGIEQLIHKILEDNGSFFPENSHNSAMRDVVIAGSMFFEDIEYAVREAFNGERYPKSTLRVYLATKAKDICRIQLTGKEDKFRTSPKPRAKYYLTTSKTNIHAMPTITL